MSSQFVGGLISADLVSSFVTEVLLVMLCYWAISSVQSRARSSGRKLRDGNEKVAGPESAGSPRDAQVDESTQVDHSSQGAQGGGAGAAAAGKLRSTSKLHQKEAACIAEVCWALKTCQWSQVLVVIQGMYQEEIFPSASFYHHVMLMAKWGKQWELIVGTFLLMQAYGVKPDASAWKLYCSATVHLQFNTEDYLARLQRRGFKGEVTTFRFMILMYKIETTPYPDFRRMQELASELQRAKLCLSTSTYNAMLAACQAPLRFGFASHIFVAMQRCGCEPDIFTLSVLVRICARQTCTSSSGERGRKFLSHVLSKHIMPDVTAAHAALDALKGEKDWSVALDILESMKHRGMAIQAETYKRAIDGFQARKQYDYAIQVAEECLTHCARFENLDLHFYSSLLTCCDACNNSDKAMFFFGEMQRYHAPGVAEYNALLQCLLKCDCEAEVQQVVSEMESAGVKKDGRTESILGMRATTDSN